MKLIYLYMPPDFLPTDRSTLDIYNSLDDVPTQHREQFQRMIDDDSPLVVRGAHIFQIMGREESC